ncbi:MAG: hypothetical protein GKR94_18140 [Gammaproteobacteria bacterium]|nr:hypothetical protein [Gammaproteobacteria bacterium]
METGPPGGGDFGWRGGALHGADDPARRVLPRRRLPDRARLLRDPTMIRRRRKARRGPAQLAAT